MSMRLISSECCLLWLTNRVHVVTFLALSRGGTALHVALRNEAVSVPVIEILVGAGGMEAHILFLFECLHGCVSEYGCNGQ